MCVGVGYKINTQIQENCASTEQENMQCTCYPLIEYFFYIFGSFYVCDIFRFYDTENVWLLQCYAQEYIIHLKICIRRNSVLMRIRVTDIN